MGCGTAAQLPVSLIQMSWGRDLLTRSINAVFTDDKLVLSELNQIFTPVTKWDCPPLSPERPGG